MGFLNYEDHKFFLSANALQILLVTYKNLSLDHLSEGCVEFLPQGKNNILRLGSRSTKKESFTSIEEVKKMSSIKIGGEVKAVERILQEFGLFFFFLI